jgi:mRNA interferase MazF
MKQGEIWLINLDPTVGAEIQKIRPAIIVVITDWKDRYEIAPWMIKIKPSTINGLSKDSSADCFQVRSVSQERFTKKIGSISDELKEEIKSGLSRVLSIENE